MHRKFSFVFNILFKCEIPFGKIMAKRKHKIVLSVVFLCLMYLFVSHRLIPLKQDTRFSATEVLQVGLIQQKQQIVPIATQICGDRYGEIVTLFTSILLQTKAYLKLYIFVDDTNWKRMNDTLLALMKKYPENLWYTLSSVSYPGVKGRNSFAEKTKPCSTIRVFFPRLLPEIDSLIYLDTDMIFFRPVEDLWSKFSEFNSSQVVAIAPDNPHKDNWYTTMAKHPYYGIHGLNTGVMLMNLTRLRKLNYTDTILNLFYKWHSKIMWGEQDLHNIWLHFHPEKLFYLPCKWNYRDSHCERGNACESAEKEGPYVIHGNGQQLVQKDPEPGFYAVNSAFVQHSSGENAKENVLKAMKRNLIGVTKDTGKCAAELLRLFKRKFQVNKMMWWFI